MNCHNCNEPMGVYDSRLEKNEVMRRRRCACGFKIKTLEVPYLPPPRFASRFSGDLSIVSNICNQFDIDKIHVLGKNKRGYVTFVRYICYYVLRTHKKYTLRRTGELFKSSPMSVAYGLKSIEAQLAADPLLYSKVNNIILRYKN